MASTFPPSGYIPSTDSGVFKPVAYFDSANNLFVYLEKDTFTYTELVPGTNIELIREGGADGPVIGVQVNSFKSVAKNIPAFP